MPLHIYLPQDRRKALANHNTLPDRTHGAALFADISGFTALTESLREKLGARQGAEELTRQLGGVYSALINEVEKYGGSVIGFAGDAMMCWFDLTPQHAVACAFGMQAAIQAFPTLGLKVAVASGAARRFIVGDPHVQQLDVLAGATVSRSSTAEHQAEKGEVLVDEATAARLADSLTITEWRTDAESNERFAVVSRCADEVHEVQTETLDSLSKDVLQSWVHRAVFERETASQDQDTFLTEFRPCVALFVRFMGIDYDSETAESELDAFIRQIQTITGRHQGALLDITIGDKGSYAYINFGALSAHEDDSRRAVQSALELKNASTLSLQMGITQGVMRVGAYGGETRKTFGALGDDVNLAARLMTNAASGEIVISSHVHKAVEPYFVFEPHPPLHMKGKAEPLPVFAVTGERKQRAIRLQEPTYALPMVGRQSELQLLNDKLDLALQGKSQIIGIVAEAGIGKSRLVAEVIRAARRKGFAGYGGACQSDGTNTPYLAWKPIWSAFFDVDPSAPHRRQIRMLEGELEDRAPERVQAMPLLSSVLDLDIPENDFTRNLEPQFRKSALMALFEDCLRAASKDEPILIVIEDLHWIDALSHDLLEDLARALADSPLFFVLAYRPPQSTRLQAPRLEALPQFTRIELHELNHAEAESAIRAKLVELYPARTGAVPASLVYKLMSRSQGNPFYLEELLNYLRDRGLDPRDAADLEKIELPDSLHALVLSRIDQLSEREKTTLRVASIVGRLFRAAWLTGYYPAVGDMAHVKADLDNLHKLDITPLDSEPELAYLFKHIVTHEVTYESLPFATRAKLHEQLAQYVEKTYTGEGLLETLTYHYGKSSNEAKQREYFWKAGAAAKAEFANEAALGYFASVLPLLKNPSELTDLHLQWGAVLELIGRWEEAETHYNHALAQSPEVIRPRCLIALGRLAQIRGNYSTSLDWLTQAQMVMRGTKDLVGLGQVLLEIGIVHLKQGELAVARQHVEKSLALGRTSENRLLEARALNNMANVIRNQGHYDQARDLYEESLTLGHKTGDNQIVKTVLTNLGSVSFIQGDLQASQAFYEEGLALARKIGDKQGISWLLNNLGAIASDQGEYKLAQSLYTEGLTLAREMGNKNGIAYSLNLLGAAATYQGDYATARTFLEESLSLGRATSHEQNISLSLILLGNLAAYQGDHVRARMFHEENLALCRRVGDTWGIAYSLNGLGHMAATLGETTTARALLGENLLLMREMGDKRGILYALLELSRVEFCEGASGRAVHLAASAETLRAAISLTITPPIQKLCSDVLDSMRAALSPEAFDKAWAEGAAMTLDEVVKFALEKGEG